MQSFPDDTNIGNTDRKTTTDISASAVANPRSINPVNSEQELTKRRTGQLDKAVVQLSSRRTLFQTILTIPPSVIELNYGINYLNQCPIQPLINVFLIVHGCSSMANGIVLLIGFITANYIKRSISHSPYSRRLLAGSLIGQLVLLLFSIAWLIVGQVWVFGAQSNDFQSTNATKSATYCYPTVFWTGFAIIIVTYIIWQILILVFIARFVFKRHKTKPEIAPITDELS